MRPTAAALFAAMLTAIVVSAAPSLALLDGPLAQSPCLAGKLKCLAKTKSCLLKCHTKAVQKGLAVDPTCLAKCRDKFDQNPAVAGKGCFARVEAKGQCGADVGNAAELAGRTDAHVRELVRDLAPAGSIPANPCSGKKIGCLRKYDDCVLKSAGKAAQKGTAIDVSKCLRVLDGSATSCVGKLERKYCGASDPSCAAPLCETYGDELQLRLQDDAFVDEVILRLVNGPRDVDTQRCSEDTSVGCSSAPGGVAGCGGGLGTCEFHLGAPIPRSFGGVSSCIVAYWNGAVSGTFDQASGATAGTASVRERAYLSSTIPEPCPICADDPVPNDGTAAGTCTSGPRSGLACDGNQRSVQPSFGTTSLDCPPAAATIIADLRFSLTNTNDGTLANTVDATTPTCNGALGKSCVCASCSGNSSITCNHDADCASVGAGTCTNPAGAPRRPNACFDDPMEPGDGSVCMSVGSGKGICPEGPWDTHCRLEAFRACSLPSDCPAAGDSCGSYPRSCFPGYDGNIGDAVTVTGSHDAERNGAAAMTFGALFCMPPADSMAVNNVLGLPGPGRFLLDGIATNDGGAGCPTSASFVPTSKGPVTDVGWSGLDHEQSRTIDATVTVATTCTGAPPSCSCTYTGPIANPNAP
jgi:hypothetical protein